MVLRRFFPSAGELSRRPLDNRFAMPRGWRREKESTQRPEGLASLFVASALIFVALLLAVFRSFVVALCALVLFVVVLRVLLTRAIEKERAQLREQVPDALRCMEACMHAVCRFRKRFPR